MSIEIKANIYKAKSKAIKVVRVFVNYANGKAYRKIRMAQILRHIVREKSQTTFLFL